MPYPTISPPFHVQLNATDYAETQLLRKLMGLSHATPPSTYHAALGQYASGAGTRFGEDGTGGSEPGPGDNYGRAGVPRHVAKWTDPALNVQAQYGPIPTSRVRAMLATEIVWPVVTTAVWDSGGRPEFFGLFDDPDRAEGNCWFETSFIPNHLFQALPGEEYYVPEAPIIAEPHLIHDFMSYVLEVTGFGDIAYSWKLKLINWFLRGIDFTAPALHLGWVQFNNAITPGTPNMVDETYIEVSTSGTGYSRLDLSGLLIDPITNLLGGTYTTLSSEITPWTATGDWGFHCIGGLFDGPSGGLITPLSEGYGFFRPQAGDPVTIGPYSPGAGGLQIGIGL